LAGACRHFSSTIVLRVVLAPLTVEEQTGFSDQRKRVLGRKTQIERVEELANAVETVEEQSGLDLREIRITARIRRA
jgi:hypothetical protein